MCTCSSSSKPSVCGATWQQWQVRGSAGELQVYAGSCACRYPAPKPAVCCAQPCSCQRWASSSYGADAEGRCRSSQILDTSRMALPIEGEQGPAATASQVSHRRGRLTCRHMWGCECSRSPSPRPGRRRRCHIHRPQAGAIQRHLCFCMLHLGGSSKSKPVLQASWGGW